MGRGHVDGHSKDRARLERDARANVPTRPEYLLEDSPGSLSLFT